MASAMAMPVARSHCEVGAPHECLAAGGAVLLRRPDGHHPGIMLPPPTAAKQQPTTNNQQPKRSTLTPTGSSIHRDVQSPMVDWQSAAVVGQYLVVTTSASSLYRFFLDLLPSSPPLLVKKPVSAMAPGTGGPSAMGYPPPEIGHPARPPARPLRFRTLSPFRLRVSGDALSQDSYTMSLPRLGRRAGGLPPPRPRPVSMVPTWLLWHCTTRSICLGEPLSKRLLPQC